MSIPGFYFGTKVAIIASWNNPESYGTPITLAAVELANVIPETVSGELKGNDRIVDIHAKVVKITGKLKMAFNDLESIAVLSGETVVDSSPNSKAIVFAETNRPYFGLAFQVSQTNGAGCLNVFVPKAKIVGPMPFAAQYGQYITPELNFTGVLDTATYGALFAIEKATANTLTLPPT